MDELLVICWEEERLTLRQIPKVGIWSSDAPVQKSVSLSRPTLISKLQDDFYRSRLKSGISTLLSDVTDDRKQVWMLLPHQWVQHFHVDNPDLSPEKLRRFLLWEAEQQLPGELSNYHVLLPSDYTERYLEVRAVRSELLQRMLDVTTETNVHLVGLSMEPNQDEAYAFQDEENLSNAISMKRKAEPVVTHTPRNWQNIAIASASVLVMVIVGICFIRAISGNGIESDYMSGERNSTLPEPIVTQKTPAVVPIASQPVKSSVRELSPINRLAAVLPSGGRIHIATISPIDFKAELVGVNNPQSWLNSAKSSGKLSEFQLETGKTVMVRSTDTDWKSAGDKFSLSSWKQRVAGKGLKANRRSGSGSYENALALVNDVWQSPDGVSKIYFASEGNRWVVTVQ